MNKNTILNILTGIVALVVIYVLIFEDVKHNSVFWGLLAVFFILVAVRARRAREKR